MKTVLKIVVPVIIIALGVLVERQLGLFQEDPAKPPTPPRSKIVRSKLVQLGTVPTSIQAYGTLSSAQPVELYSEVQGVLLKGDIVFQPAQTFSKGDLLLKVDDRQAALDLNASKSDFLNAFAAVLPEIKIDFPEEYPIWEQYFNNCDFASDLQDLPKAPNQKIKLFLSRFNVYKLFFAVRNLEILLDKHRIYAPFNGSIVSADLRAGSNVRNGSRLGTIINLQEMEVEAPVPAEDIAWIDHGQAVRLEAVELNSSWNGRISRIGKVIDERTQTIPVFIELGAAAGNQTLFQGAFLNVSIPGRKIDSSVALHRKALYEDRFVYVVDGGALDYREVQVARSLSDSVIVDAGLSTGDTLVTEVLQGVARGMPARAVLSAEAPGGAQ